MSEYTTDNIDIRDLATGWYAEKPETEAATLRTVNDMGVVYVPADTLGFRDEADVNSTENPFIIFGNRDLILQTTDTSRFSSESNGPLVLDYKDTVFGSMADQLLGGMRHVIDGGIPLNLGPESGHVEMRKFLEKDYRGRSVKERVFDFIETELPEAVRQVTERLKAGEEVDLAEDLFGDITFRVSREVVGLPEDLAPTKVEVDALTRQAFMTDLGRTDVEPSGVDTAGFFLKTLANLREFKARGLDFENTGLAGRIYKDDFELSDVVEDKDFVAQANAKLAELAAIGMDVGNLSDLLAMGATVITDVAAYHTTSATTAKGTRDLLKHPEQVQMLIDAARDPDPSVLKDLANSAAHEMIRYSTSVPTMRRDYVGTGEFFEGEWVEPGTKVLLHYPAANRDPVLFENPDEFDITRTNNDENLSFGADGYMSEDVDELERMVSTHKCLGKPVAVYLIRNIIEEMARQGTFEHIQPQAAEEIDANFNMVASTGLFVVNGFKVQGSEEGRSPLAA